ncbi:MAG: cytochrome c biogenesis protein CcsA, partial [Armatimonadota bacterium]|nr:cytochrome c biogenesis protein CcsA [Armatimonadota bacterium]
MTNQLSLLFFKVAIVLYIGAAVFYIINFISQRKAFGDIGRIALITALAPHVCAVVIRGIVSKRPPFLNLYEYMLSVTLGIVILYLALEFSTKSKVFGAAAVPLVALGSIFTLRLPSEVAWTMPALKSAWRVPHISTAILAYSAFAIAFCLGILYLLRERSENGRGFLASRIPSLNVLDHTAYRMIAFGFL